jgi:hypothetical protein
MNIDEVNILCAQIAQKEKEKRIDEYVELLEEEELMNLEQQKQQEIMSYNSDSVYSVVGLCEGCFDYQDA